MKKINFILIVLISSVALSNVRVGRTGGGLAEMKAYSIVGQISTFLNICVNSPFRCGMNENQKNDLIRLSQKINLKKLQLIAPWSGPSKLEGLTLFLNSQDLYTSGVPHKFGQILSLSLSVLLRDGLGISESAALWPYEVFYLFEENMRSIYLYQASSTLHSFSLANPDSKESIVQALALEKSKTTDDLTSNLLSVLGCPNAFWKIESWTYVQHQNWVRAQILWNCGSHQWSGELQIRLNATGASQMSLVRKTQLR